MPQLAGSRATQNAQRGLGQVEAVHRPLHRQGLGEKQEQLQGGPQHRCLSRGRGGL